MSIWCSVDAHGDDIRALNGDDMTANYAAQGEPTMTVDVAWTAWHDGIRLAIWGDGEDVTLILNPKNAIMLRDRLSAALFGDVQSRDVT